MMGEPYIIDKILSENEQEQFKKLLDIIANTNDEKEKERAEKEHINLIVKAIEREDLKRYNERKNLPIPANQITYALSELFLGKKFVEGEFEEDFSLGTGDRIYSLTVSSAHSEKTTKAILFNSQDFYYGYSNNKNPTANAKRSINKDVQLSIANDIIKEFFDGNPAIALKHFLGVLSAINKKGWSNFEINDHLDLLGYKRQKGEHLQKNKRTARLAIELFSSFEFCLTDSKGNIILNEKNRINSIHLFTIVGKERNKDSFEVEAMTLTANPDWYNFAKGYTQNYLKILQVDVRKYPYVLPLVFLLSIKFKLDKKKTLKYRKETIYKKFSIEIKNKNRDIERIHSQFDHMVKEDFLKSWKQDREFYYFTCNDILGNILDDIDRNKPAIEISKHIDYTSDEVVSKLQNYLKLRALSISKFSKIAGIDKGNLSKIMNGKIRMSDLMKKKILEAIEG